MKTIILAAGRMPVLDGLGTADYDNYDHDYRDYDRGG